MAHHIASLLLLALCFLFLSITVVPEDDVEMDDKDVDRAVMLVLSEAITTHHLEPKQACALMKVGYSHWLKIVRGEKNSPSLTKLTRLPIDVLLDVLPKIGLIGMRRHFLAQKKQLAELSRSQERKRA